MKSDRVTKGEPEKDRKLPLWSLLPNLITIGGIVAGLSAVRFAFEGNFVFAAQLIVLACILDGLDGRVARLMKTQSKLGAELDSLSDFANFGVAPALVLYFWALKDINNPGWIAVLFFAICCALRLARFNVSNKSENQPSSDFFVGVPAPAGALLVLLPVFLSFLGFESLRSMGILIAAYMVLIGLLFISQIPTYSFKRVSVYRRSIKFILIGFVIALAVFVSYPWASLVALDLGYAGVLIWSYFKFKRRSAGKV